MLDTADLRDVIPVIYEGAYHIAGLNCACFCILSTDLIRRSHREAQIDEANHD